LPVLTGALAATISGGKKKRSSLAHRALIGYHAMTMNPAAFSSPNLRIKGRPYVQLPKLREPWCVLPIRSWKKTMGWKTWWLVGIKRRGVPLADRLSKLIQQI